MRRAGHLVLAVGVLFGRVGSANAQLEDPAAPPPPPPVTETSEETEPPAPEPAAAAETEDEPLISIGKGRLKIGLLLQSWLFTRFGEEEENGPRRIENTFRIRRAEIKLEGQVVPDVVGYGLMIDPAKLLPSPGSSDTLGVDTDGDGEPDATVLRYRTDDSILQDFWVSFLSVPSFELRVGQFKRPLGFEGPYSSSRIVFDERSEVSRTLSGDNRDLGIMGTLSIEPLKVDLGVFNGTPTVFSARSGLNEADQNPSKDVVLRIGATPVDGLELGVSGLYGVEGPLQQGPDPGSATDLRYGAWVRFSNDRLDLRAEGIGQSFTVEAGPDVPKLGFYVLGEVRVLPNLGVGARFGWFDADTEEDGDRSINTDVTGGVNYYIDEHNAKVQLAYTASIEGDLSDDEGTEEGSGVPDDTWTLVAQVAF